MISDSIIGLIFLLILILLIILRFPIAISLILSGVIGTLTLSEWQPVLSQFKTIAFYRFSSYELSIIPLFILMGQFAQKAEISLILFNTFSSWFGHKRGGLAIATIASCAGFGAINGSSIATASTMSQIALPEMKKRKYSNTISSGSLAAGGTLGILIPPSVVLVIYSIIAEQNITYMFAAAFIPGFLAVLGYIITISIYVKINPQSAITEERKDLVERIVAIKKLLPLGFIFIVVIGGIYSGIFTPTEAASIGTFLTFCLAIKYKKLDIKKFKDCFFQTAKISGMIFLILLGTDFFNSFLGRSMLPQELGTFISALGLSPITILLIIIIIYLILGLFLESLSMVLLTIPIFFPIIMNQDFGLTHSETAIWFGVIILIIVELGLITPPFGLNLFIINSIAKDIKISEIFKGVIPFILSDIVRIIILIIFPSLSLILVRLIN
ncbi:MAG: C4-dicarboxylate ABC transporter permease [Rhodospirillaceae bacterium]|nr:C4-dicarboxylate ABC transporter permease [Rhodospirillaceae bacterium]|tara:strand:- start:3465 stop:4787 length:1323 start_codon:yes stop_codon:yes gene_type:complete